MNSELDQLAVRIRAELGDLDAVVVRVAEGWQRALRSSDDFYLDSVALNLHGFYAGLERIFELTAALVDGNRPAGENWHQTLLRQMAAEVTGVRPAILSELSLDRLNEYRGFRHVVRNVYTWKFDPAKVEQLVINLPQVFQQVRAELMAFADFLERRA